MNKIDNVQLTSRLVANLLKLVSTYLPYLHTSNNFLIPEEKKLIGYIDEIEKHLDGNHSEMTYAILMYAIVISSRSTFVDIVNVGEKLIHDKRFTFEATEDKLLRLIVELKKITEFFDKSREHKETNNEKLKDIANHLNRFIKGIINSTEPSFDFKQEKGALETTITYTREHGKGLIPGHVLRGLISKMEDLVNLVERLRFKTARPAGLTYTINTFRQSLSDLIDYYHSLDVNSERLTCPDVHY